MGNKGLLIVMARVKPEDEAAFNKWYNEDHLPKFREAVKQESEKKRRELEQPLPPASLATWPKDEPPPRLGVTWREDEAEPGSVFLTRVVEGTPAAEAGLAVGDRIIELDDQPFADGDILRTGINASLDAARPEMKLLTERRGHLRTVTVKLRPS